MEFMFGRPLSPEELEMLRQQIEAMDDITAIDGEVRGIVERNWPHLLSKLPSEDPSPTIGENGWMRLSTDQTRALRLLDEAEPRGCTEAVMRLAHGFKAELLAGLY
jgi:hypothetical protein